MSTTSAAVTPAAGPGLVEDASRPRLTLVRGGAPAEATASVSGSPRASWLRDEAGATTAEYATVTGCGVGFAAVLFKFLTSDAGQQLLRMVFDGIRSLLPF